MNEYKLMESSGGKKIMVEMMVLLICLITLGLAVEKMVHLDYDIVGVTVALKQDIGKFTKALFAKTQIRHAFDITLTDDIKMVTKPYAKQGFEIQLANKLFKNVPVIAIRFVPDHPLEENELQELVRLLLIKLREYMAYYGFNWKNFGTYSVGSDYVTIFIHYAEWECDMQPFVNVYRQMVRHKVDKTGGILRDIELEEELKRVS